MRTMWVRLSVMAVLVTSGIGAAMAEDFRHDCPPGSYLTGFVGHSGEWIDKMAMACSQWDAARGRLAKHKTFENFAGRSDGGGEQERHCPEGRVVSAIESQYARWGEDGIPVLHNVVLKCHPASPDGEPPLKFGSGSPIKPRPKSPFDSPVERTFPSACADGYVGVGIYGRHELFVGWLGLVCGPAPKASPVSATKPIGPNAHRDTMVSKRKGGDLAVGSDSGGDAPPPPPPPPQVAMAETTNDTDVYRKSANGAFVRTDDDPSHFLPKGFAAPLLAKEGGWWLLDLKDVDFVKGEGWVAADQLKMK